MDRYGSFLDDDIAVPGFARIAAVDLQADDAALGDLRVALGVIHRLHAVEEQPDPRPFAADLVLVPAGLHHRAEQRLVGRHQGSVPPRFVVQRSPEAAVGARVHVGLEARDLEVIGHALRAELDAAVGVADQLALRAKDEVRVGLRRAEEGVVGHPCLERAAHDRPVFDAERLGRIALPAGEGAAVEQHLALGRRLL